MIGHRTQYFLSLRLLRYYDALTIQQRFGCSLSYPEWLLIRIHEVRDLAN